MKYGYGRVSTVGQEHHGNSLDDQRKKLLEAGADEIITDTYTGTKMDRPGLTGLLARIQPGDTLIVCKLDRFARTAVEGATIINELHGRGVTVNVLNMGVVDHTPMGQLMVTMLLAFAQFERDMIVERTQSGKAAAREKGIRVDGRPPKFSKSQVSHALELLDDHSYSEVSEMTGISISTLTRARRKGKSQNE